MARARYGNLVIFTDVSNHDALKAVGGTQVTVYEPGTTTPIAQTIYAGPTGGTTRTNPFTAALDGSVEFWLDVQQFVKVKFDASLLGLTPPLGANTLDNEPTVAVVVVAPLSDGSKHVPPQPFNADADLGWYRYTGTLASGSNVMDVSTPQPAILVDLAGAHTNPTYYPLRDTDQYLLIGAGNDPSNGFVTIQRDGIDRTTPQLGAAEGFPTVPSGLAIYQGSSGKPIQQGSEGGVRVQVVAAGNGGTTSAGTFMTTVSHGSAGDSYGVKARISVGAGFTGSNKPFYAGSFSSESDAGGTSQIVGGLIVGAQGRNDGDLVQGAEIVVGTRSDNYTTPSQRVVLILGTKDNEWSRRGGIDAMILGVRKGTPGDVDHLVNVQPFTNGWLLGDNQNDMESWPFDTTSAWFRANPNLDKSVANVMGDVVNLHNTWVNGSIVKVPKKYDAIPSGTALDILGTGWIGIGASPPLSPLDIEDDASATAMRFKGATFLTAGAAYPGSAVKKLVVSYWDGSAWQPGWIGINT